MSKWTVTHTGTDGATVTVVSAAGVGQDSDFLVFINEANTVVASFPVSRVVSVIKIKKDKDDGIESGAKLPELSRNHPVYAYGKGDLRDALLHAVMWQDRGNNASAYLRDIIRDLKKGS